MQHDSPVERLRVQLDRSGNRSVFALDAALGMGRALRRASVADWVGPLHTVQSLDRSAAGDDGIHQPAVGPTPRLHHARDRNSLDWALKPLLLPRAHAMLL